MLSLKNACERWENRGEHCSGDSHCDPAPPPLPPFKISGLRMSPCLKLLGLGLKRHRWPCGTQRPEPCDPGWPRKPSQQSPPLRRSRHPKSRKSHTSEDRTSLSQALPVIAAGLQSCLCVHPHPWAFFSRASVLLRDDNKSGGGHTALALGRGEVAQARVQARPSAQHCRGRRELRRLALAAALGI